MVTTAFRAFAEKTAGKDLGEFFELWHNQTGLPSAGATVPDRSR